MIPTRLIYSAKAQRELHSLLVYIAERESLEIAVGYIDRIQRRCERILLAPQQELAVIPPKLE